MKWRGLGFVALAALGGCTTLLGGFTVGDGGAPDATDDVGGPEGGADVVALDAPKDAPPDGPPCGAVNQACCVNNACNASSCCSATCLDTKSDPKNCGTCGHDCLGSGCKNGVCQPQSMFTGKSSLPGRIRDAMGTLVWMDRDLVDGGNQSGNVFTCSKQSCQPTTLLSGLDGLQDIVLDAPSFTTVYVAAGVLALDSCAIGGCGNSPSSVSIGVSSGPGGMAYRNGTIYSTLNIDAYQFLPDGTSQVELGTGNEPASEFEAPPSTTYIYWNAGKSGANEVRVTKDGTSMNPSTFWPSPQAVAHLASDGGFLAWSVYSGSAQDIFACPVGAQCASPTTIAKSVQVSYARGGLGMDPKTDEVLWLVNGNKEVQAYACSAASCSSPRLVADVPTNNAATAGAIIADPMFYYFTMSDGSTDSLYRVAK